MSWLLSFQWPAGVALMMYGILTWADELDPVLGHQLSTWSEQSPPYSLRRLLVGLISGSTLHGKRGFAYCQRRYLAGLLSPGSACIFAFGMAAGIFIPATIIMITPYYVAFPLLISGMAIQLACRGPALRHIGWAMVGIGCCWIGFTACREASLPANLMPYALVGVLLLAGIMHTPAAAFLAIAASLNQIPLPHLTVLLCTALFLAMTWLLGLGLKLWRAVRPFDPPLSLLAKRDLAFPERALQAALQENRRMAVGLARAAYALAGKPGKPNATTAPTRIVQDVEKAMDEFKPAAQHYLLQLTRYRLHIRQARLTMFLFIHISDLERISDHLLAVAQYVPTGSSRSDYPKALLQALDAMLSITASTIDTLAQSITGNRDRKQIISDQVQAARDTAIDMLDQFTGTLQVHIRKQTITTAQAIRMQELRSHFERLIRHVRAIATAGAQDDFWIEPDAIHERAIRAHQMNTGERLSLPQLQELIRKPEH